MSQPVSRRDLMRASAAGAASLAAARAVGLPAEASAGAAPAALPPYVGAGSTAPVRPFQLYEVTLGSGLFQEKRNRIKRFLRAYDERRFLVLFNNLAGRPNPNRKRDDGLPDYDVPVEGIPSPGQDGPTILDLVWDAASSRSSPGWAKEFTDAGVFTAGESDRVVAAAGRAESQLAP